MVDTGMSSRRTTLDSTPVSIVAAVHDVESPTTYTGVLTSQQESWLGVSDGDGGYVPGNVQGIAGLAFNFMHGPDRWLDRVHQSV
jgi:hypothetical protein